jgi:sugar/nucleoside kinase (ribokinase family)
MSQHGTGRFDYVTVGHITVDVMTDDGGSRRPGGGAFYSALQAARLGLRTLIVTKGAPGELEELLEPYREELEVRVLPAEHTTTLATTGAGAQRRQRVLAWAGPIAEPIEVDTAILHLAAVARETPNRWQGRAEFVGVTPQGLVRQWDDNGAISLVPLDRRVLPERFDALVISDIERPCCLVEGPGVVAITAGSAPTVVILHDGTVERVPVPAAEHQRDDLGAGDVFAAAFFVALHEGRSPADGAAYGNAAAAVRVAGVGAQAIGDRAAIAGAPQAPRR